MKRYKDSISSSPQPKRTKTQMAPRETKGRLTFDGPYDELVMYTDGSCINNPGAGGWAAIVQFFQDGRKVNETSIWNGQTNTTNNQMEMKAAINALDYSLNYCKRVPVTIYTDSNYVKDGITSWIANWKKNGWRTANRKPVKNKELWIEFDSKLKAVEDRSSVKWIWVKGHSGHEENDRVDRLAREQALLYSS